MTPGEVPELFACQNAAKRVLEGFIGHITLMLVVSLPGVGRPETYKREVVKHGFDTP